MPSPIRLRLWCRCYLPQVPRYSMQRQDDFLRVSLRTSLSIALTQYRRVSVSGNKITCWFCKRCGTRVIHERKGAETINVKGGCIRNLNYKNARHIWCKHAVRLRPFIFEFYFESLNTQPYHKRLLTDILGCPHPSRRPPRRRRTH